MSLLRATKSVKLNPKATGLELEIRSPSAFRSDDTSPSDEEISRMIKLYESQTSSASKSKKKKANSGTQEYKRRLVHLALYRSVLPKFVDNHNETCSVSANTNSTSRSGKSLQPKSIYSEDTPRIANLSDPDPPHLISDGKCDVVRNEIGAKQKKRTGVRRERAKYCLAEKDQTMKFLHRLASVSTKFLIVNVSCSSAFVIPTIFQTNLMILSLSVESF